MDDNFKIETRFSDSKGFFPYAAAIAAVLGIVLILLTMTTGIASRLLPMDDNYLAVLIPAAPDGSEALSLQTLEQQVEGKTVVVHGAVMNRTEHTITGLEAVLDIKDQYGIQLKVVTIPIEPADLAAAQTGTFDATATVEDRDIAGYSVRFRLPTEGPFVPHKDERPPTTILSEPVRVN